MLGKRLPVPKTHKDWLEQRRQGITGTDIAGLMGISNYKSPMSIYVDKIDPPIPKDPSIPMKLGNALEEPIAQFWVAENPGHKIRKINTSIQHPKHKFALCNIDRHIVSPEESVLECKLVGVGKSGEWKENSLPDEYYLQVMWQLVCTGLPYAHVAAIIGGTKYEERIVQYDETLGNKIIELAGSFWEDHVLSRVPPAIDGSDPTTDALTRLFASDDKKAAAAAAKKFLGSDFIQIPYQADEIIRQYAEQNSKIKALTEQRDALVEQFVDGHERATEQLLQLVGEKNALANELRMMVGAFEEATTPSGLKVTWKTQETRRIDTAKIKKELGEDFYLAHSKVTKSRTLRIPRGKKL